MNNHKTYINFIGMDGSGKDTIFAKVIADYPEAVLMYEPGGTFEADVIRYVLLNVEDSISNRITKCESILSSVNSKCHDLLQLAITELIVNGLTGTAEMYLYAASRAQTMLDVIEPALQSGKKVFGRRSLACSVSYQGYTRGLGMEKVFKLNSEAIGFCYPTLEILFDLPAEVAIDRISKRTEKKDRLDLEPFTFYQDVREGYLRYYKEICPYPYVIIDASLPIEEVYQAVLLALKEN
jgi:dTMP kinase